MASSPGWFEFINTVLEYSATPLLDVQSDPTLAYVLSCLSMVILCACPEPVFANTTRQLNGFKR
jgi:hypothetical protein